jgi:iron complex transport system ATP-binding protein
MIDFISVNFSYNSHFFLKNLNFSVKDGEFLGIIGPNGAGKSTLLRLVDRILKPDSGQIKLNGKSLSHYTRKELARIIGFVPQEFSSSFQFTALEIVMMGRFPHQKPLAFDSRQDRLISLEAMTATDCLYLKDRDFQTLSGGERQRVVLASALAQEPIILLLDEPTSALDIRHQIHFYEILRALRQERGMTIITVTHDVNLAAQFCERIMVIKNGEMIADGPVTTVIRKEILESVYGIPVEIIQHPATGLPVIYPRSNTAVGDSV